MRVPEVCLRVYAFATFAVLTAGVLALVFAIVWRAPNLIRNLTLSTMDLNSMLLIATRLYQHLALLFLLGSRHCYWCLLSCDGRSRYWCYCAA